MSLWSALVVKIGHVMLTGIVYLLHFDRPFNGPMQHYVGFTSDLDQRLDNHRNGTACATTRRAFNQGIGFTLARTWWPGSPQLERRIKDCGPVNYCPLCPRRPRPSERVRSSRFSSPTGDNAEL
jgi:predicted GIY-YIG superfamily endonuclease